MIKLYRHTYYGSKEITGWRKALLVLWLKLTERL